MVAFAVLLTVSAYFLISDKVDENTQTQKYESIDPTLFCVCVFSSTLSLIRK